LNGACPTSCAFAQAHANPLAFPIGQVRRVAVADPKSGSGDVDETKRNVLKLLGIAGLVAGGGGLIGGSIQYAQPPQIGASNYPRVQILDVDGSPLTSKKVMAEYNVSTPDVLTFAYPLRNEPNFLLNLAPAAPGGPGATKVPGGVGPQGSIVAYSAICQHLGCPAPAIAYYPPGTCAATPGGKTFYIHCSCHGSTYDVTNAASNLTGPAVLPLPQVTLDWDPSSDQIFATAVVGPPVNGHLDTLIGDYPVGASSGLIKQTPIILCDNFP
jgi:Rieske Fe-S protein